VLTGIRTCLEAAGLQDLPLQGHRCRGEGTGPMLSVTGMGLVEPAAFTPGRARPGDEVYMVGHQIDRPEEQLKPNDATIPGFAHLQRLRTAAHDVLPVGNVPMPQAVAALAEAAGLVFRPVPGVPDWLWTRPAGPATCLLAAVPRTAVPVVTALPLPVTHIGRLEAPPA
ncbi:MAG: hypothetical protein OWV35_01875, partial [Firmicutes bacterium]|nr:hypothetical protein [Bacillota bacterium]